MSTSGQPRYDEHQGRLVVWFPKGWGFAHVPSLPADVLVRGAAFPPKARPRRGDFVTLRVRQADGGRLHAVSARLLYR